MTPDECVILARYVRSLCPQQKFDEYTPDAWYDILFDLDLAEARTAAAAVASRQAFVAPGEIATEARKNRRTLITADAETEAPAADPNNVPLYLRQLRSRRRNIATGTTPPVAAITARVTEADVSAMRQQKDLAAFIKQNGREAAARCAARAQIINRHPDLAEQVAELLGRPNWNGYIAPEFDSTGQRNTCHRRAGLLSLLAEAEQRNTASAA